MNKVIPFGKIGDYVTSELIITDKYRMIIDYNPPYRKEENKWKSTMILQVKTLIMNVGKH